MPQSQLTLPHVFVEGDHTIPWQERFNLSQVISNSRVNRSNQARGRRVPQSHVRDKKFYWCSPASIPEDPQSIGKTTVFPAFCGFSISVCVTFAASCSAGFRAARFGPFWRCRLSGHCLGVVLLGDEQVALRCDGGTVAHPGAHDMSRELSLGFFLTTRSHGMKQSLPRRKASSLEDFGHLGAYVRISPP